MKKIITFGLLLIIIFMPITLKAQSKNNTKAYRNIYFEMSKIEIQEEIDEDEKLEESLLGVRGFGTEVGGKDYFIYPDYFENQLYNLYFMGDTYLADFYDRKVLKNKDALVKIISNTYGTPSQKKKTPNISDIPLQKEIWTEIWDLDKRNIKIGLYQNYENRYATVMEIVYEPLAKKVEEKKEKEQDKEIEDSSDDF